VFKHELKNKVVIVAVGIQLNKSWHPVSSYGPLRAIGAEEISPSRIFKEVVATRMSKLPDPSVTGNAGSFFKNPVISKEKFEQLKTIHPDIVAYQVDEGFKIAAGWLIDSCSLKGEAVGGAMVHEAQALVLVNANKATAMNVVELALQVRKTVLDKYGIKLEHEVRFFDRTEETSLDSMVKHG
jgi:UDP-N-acetylmuramate dehydrogenase